MYTITTIHNTLRNGEFPKKQLEAIPGVLVDIEYSKHVHFHEQVTITFKDDEAIKTQQDALEVAFELGRLTQQYLNK